jgi:hypothetical protein
MAFSPQWSDRTSYAARGRRRWSNPPPSPPPVSAGADLTLEIEHVQVVNAGVILVSAVVAAHFLIAAGAERFVAFAGQTITPMLSS